MSTLYLWMLSSSQWHCQPGRFSMATHRLDRRGIYRCVLLRFHGRIEIDHSYGLCCHGLCCHSQHSTRGAGRCGRKQRPAGRPHSCCARSGSTNHSSADHIVVNSYNHNYIVLCFFFERLTNSLTNDRTSKPLQDSCKHIQCSAFITGSILSHIHKDTLWLTREGEVFCGYSIWLIFYLNSCNYLCNIL